MDLRCYGTPILTTLLLLVPTLFLAFFFTLDCVAAYFGFGFAVGCGHAVNLAPACMLRVGGHVEVLLVGCLALSTASLPTSSA
jgi:hypothetical protein